MYSTSTGGSLEEEGMIPGIRRLFNLHSYVCPFAVVDHIRITSVARSLAVAEAEAEAQKKHKHV